MSVSWAGVWGVVTVVCVTAVVTGPAVSGVDVTRTPLEFGEGTAAVADVDLVDTPAVESGRFGTAIHYLRGPTARVTVRGVTGTPRLVLRVEAPEFDYDETATTVLQSGDRGTYRLAIEDHSIERDDLPDREIAVRTTVRVQSFTDDRVVYESNESVGGSK